MSLDLPAVEKSHPKFDKLGMNMIRVSYQGLAEQLPSSLSLHADFRYWGNKSGPSQVRKLLDPNIPFFLLCCPNIPSLPRMTG